MAKSSMNQHNIRSILERIMRRERMTFSAQVYLIEKNWQDIVGAKLFSYTMPRSIYKKVLSVNCLHQGLIPTLQSYKSQFFQRIMELKEKNKILNGIEIEDIRFVFGKVQHPDIPEIKKTVKKAKKESPDPENWEKNLKKFLGNE
ncbi:MAG: DUF721 domain-containing protein [Spirochaetes bacterium]|nr:DUF721 domain-containing protein [Spirochaetota bacterium]